MGGTYGTSFTESEAILAMQEGDIGEVDRILAEMLPGELERLADAAERLARRIRATTESSPRD